MSTTEWATEDGQPVSLPSMVSSSDLFDGELFGDELIDIYNSSVDDEADIQGIAALDPSTTDSNEIGSVLIQDHPGAHIHDDTGAQIAATVAALDDGLGAFRPSTSFNDLTTLMQNQAADSQAPQPPQAEPSAAPKSSKKRSAPVAADGQPPKKSNHRARRQSSSKKPTVPSSKKNSVVVDQSATATTLAAPAVVTPSGTSGEDAAATAAAVAASLPSLPELGDPTMVTSGPLPDEDCEMKIEATATVEIVPSDSSVGSTVNTDSQFKSIAQQAVSNLIFNAAGSTSAPATGPSVSPVITAAGSTASHDDSSDDDDKSKVDTSTAHIKALTGNNWVAACNGSVASAAPPVPQPPVDPKNNNRVRRQSLTPDERARQNRDRNREHARNTRLRKKAYVEELKRTLTELVAQRDAVDLEKRQAYQREVEQREVRFRVMEEFMKLRGRNEPNFARWSAILEDGFSLTVPVASFCKKTAGAEVIGFEQKLNSVETVMAESTMFSGFLQTMKADGEGAVTLSIVCDRKNFFMDGCNAVLEWTASTSGGKVELQLRGLIRGHFSPASNKLMSATISYDCGAISAQLHAKNLSFNGDEIDVAAAQADAILDLLKIDDVHLNVVVPSDVSVMIPSGSSASVITEKGADSSDDFSTGHLETTSKGDSSVDISGMTSRRAARRD